MAAVADHTTPPPAADGLVLHVKFDETTGTTAADASGNSNTGLLRNGAVFGSGGKFNNALNLDGVNDFVEVLNNASLNPATAITLSAWVKATVWSGNREIIIKNQGSQYRLSYLDGKIKFLLGGVTGSLAVDPPGAGTWHLITGTYDGSTMRLYINATQVASTATSGGISTSTNPVSIGSRGGYENTFGGLIDEARVYNRALSATEVSALSAATGNARLAQKSPAQEAEWTVKLHPNPAADFMIVESQRNLTDAVITLADARGIRTTPGHTYLSSNAVKINCAGLTSGVYVLSVKFADGESAAKKIVVQQ